MQVDEKKVLDSEKKVCILLKTEMIHSSHYTVDKRKLIRHIVGMIVDFKIVKEVLQVLRSY